MDNFKPLLAVIAASVTLAGCGNDPVNNIKNSSFPKDQTLTIAQALDNRHVCDSVEWSTLKDDYGREIIQYQCHLSSAKEQLESKLVEARKKTEKDRIDRITDSDKRIEDAKQRLNNYKTRLASLQAELDDAKLGNFVLSDSESSRKSKIISEIDEVKRNKGDLEYFGLARRIEMTEQRLENARRTSNSAKFIARLEKEIEDTKDYVEVEYENRLERLNSQLEQISEKRERDLENLISRLENRVTYEKERTAEVEESLNYWIDRKDKDLVAFDETREAFDNRNQERYLVSSVYEIFQWIWSDQDDAAQLIYGGIHYKSALDSSINTSDYSSADTAFNLIKG